MIIKYVLVRAGVGVVGDVRAGCGRGCKGWGGCGRGCKGWGGCGRGCKGWGGCGRGCYYLIHTTPGCKMHHIQHIVNFLENDINLCPSKKVDNIPVGNGKVM